MPYKTDVCGIYKIVNTTTNECYVGQSQYVRKRLKEHFRLLRHNKHTNRHLQHAFNKYGEHSFVGELEVKCEDPSDLDVIEEAFLKKDAWFVEPVVYNIAAFAKAPMRGKQHSEEVRKKIRLGRRASTFDFKSAEYRATLAAAQKARFHADPKFIDKLRFIVDHPDMSYAARARAVGSDTSSVRRLAIKYAHLKGTL